MEGLLFHQHLLIAILILAIPVIISSSSSSNTKYFQFNVEWKTVTRLCHTKPVLTVNGKYPGPTIIVYEGDNVQVKVTNKVATNTTIHWHGVRQKRTGWADGPAYITQCPIGAGKTYTYNFSVVDQRGTLWWHAHFSWQRASLYGAFIIYPRTPFPFQPILNHHNKNNIPPLIFGEWWNDDVDAVEKEMMLYGGGPKTSDAYTINGLPGPLYPCSTQDTFILTVEPNKTYLLRIINAALNDELFFAIDNHNLTVVEIDASYTKPFTTTAIMLAPGQTTSVLLTTNQVPDPTGMFVMAARPYLTSIFPFDNSTTIAFLNYQSTLTKIPNNYSLPQNLPIMQDTPFATRFSDNLKSLDSEDHPCGVPKTVDKRVVTTISLNLQDCPANQTCKGYRNKRFYASMNNQSFVQPNSSSLLESYYYKLNSRLASDYLPENPANIFNYTGVDPVSENMNTNFGTTILRVPFGTRLEIVMQGTNFLNPENHPMHVHGHNVFVVGSGFGNFDATKDPIGYNLVDPPERNTVAVPMGGWAAMRLIADNPGVWFIHCHLEEHMSWGLGLGFVVESGNETSQCLLPPPSDLPPC
ncbi:sphingosine N-acyltransferase lac1 [Castilleja foliolosa]|uniref:Laccase n=1 Tax=Castilleja foliolosa TaxID=1961234 RepID=A0ABD3DFD2_9LAMI